MSNDDLIERLRKTPNWMRESYGDWKGCVSVYDRAPFEAADALEAADKRIAELEAELQQRAKQIGVACMKHDLTHSLACGRCLAEAELLLRASVKRGGELIGEKEEAERKLAIAVEAMTKAAYLECNGVIRVALAQIGGEDAN